MGDNQVVSSDRAVEALLAGEVVAIPTDTVYGLAASLESLDAIEAIYSIKGREETRALPVLIDNPSRLEAFAVEVPETAYALIDAFWPGALTIVLRASTRIPDAIHRGAGTVGLRMPDHPVAQAIIASSGGGLAVTSANLSGEPEARSVEEVFRALGTQVRFAVDGGTLSGGIPSTVVDLTGPTMSILRRGAISREDLERATEA